VLPPSWPPPTGTPVDSWGWYRATDGRWYRSSEPPAPGYVLGASGRWVTAHDPDARRTDAAWRWSRWGLGDAWWGALVYVVGSLVLSAAMLAVAAVRAGDLDDLELGPYAIAFLVVGNVAAFWGVPWLASKRKGLQSLRADFGLHLRPVDLAIGVGFGIGGLVGAGIVGTAIDAAFDVEETTSNVPVDTLHGAGEVVLFFLAVAVVTPIVEELFFRGLVYRSFLKRGRSVGVAMAATTAIFVIPHLTAAEDLASLVSLGASIAVLGFAFQLACQVTQRRLGAPIVAHLVVNGAAVLVLAFG
jgi:membrane protease YdiL (CAAX protease family)